MLGLGRRPVTVDAAGLNSSAIQFAAATANYGIATHVAVFDNLVGGLVTHVGELAPDINLIVGAKVTIPAGGLVLSSAITSNSASGAGLVTIKTAGAALSGHRVVVTESGVLQYASNLVESHALSLTGLTLSAVSTGQSVELHTFGQLTDPSFSFDVTKAIYLGVDGSLIQIIAAAPAFVVELARPLSSDTLFWQPRSPIFQ